MSLLSPSDPLRWALMGAPYMLESENGRYKRHKERKRAASMRRRPFFRAPESGKGRAEGEAFRPEKSFVIFLK